MTARRFAVILTLTSLPGCGPVAGDPTPDGSSTVATTAGASSETPTTTVEPTTSVDTTGQASTGSLSTTTDATTPSDDSGSFIIPPESCSDSLEAIDGEWRCSMVECDVFAQDCGRGEKCAPWGEGGASTWNAKKCTPVIGTGVAGDPCTAEGMGLSGVDDCALGFMCWDVDAEGHGTCVALCTGNEQAPTCTDGLACRIVEDEVLYLCLPPCDPLAQDCPGGEECIATGGSFFCVADFSGDTGAANDVCEFANGCDPGLICLQTSEASSACDPLRDGCCQPFCQLPDGACPNPDQVCKPVYEPSPPGFEAVGACSLP